MGNPSEFNNYVAFTLLARELCLNGRRTTDNRNIVESRHYGATRKRTPASCSRLRFRDGGVRRNLVRQSIKNAPPRARTVSLLILTLDIPGLPGSRNNRAPSRNA